MRILEFTNTVVAYSFEDLGPKISTGLLKNTPKLNVSVFNFGFLMIQFVESNVAEHKNSAV